MRERRKREKRKEERKKKKEGGKEREIQSISTLQKSSKVAIVFGVGTRVKGRKGR